MKVVKEAYTDNCKVVFDPEYVTIQHSAGGDVIHMSHAEAKEVVEWLSHELGRVLPEVIQMVPSVEAKTWEAKKPVAKAPEGPVYEPGPREATQTVPLAVGDPFLAYRSSGGRTNVSGDGDVGVTDLGALAAKVSKF